jgi:hypothetical protein
MNNLRHKRLDYGLSLFDCAKEMKVWLIDIYRIEQGIIPDDIGYGEFLKNGVLSFLIRRGIRYTKT